MREHGENADAGGAILEKEDSDLGGKYLTFTLAGEVFGLPILKVREIIGLMDITPVPHAPAHVRGVINLRGKVIPVVDLRRQFGMAAVEAHERNCIIVVDVLARGRLVNVGILVDGVSEVLDIASADIEPPPLFGNGLNTDFILGLAKAGGTVKILLAIEQILAPNEGTVN
jgi:purine-binding chemotaxis protein CheW